MKSILFLSHFFPPYSNVQSKINLSTVYSLRDLGLLPVIVTSDVPEKAVEQDFLELVKGLKIYRYRHYAASTAMDRFRGKLRIPRESNIFYGVRKNMLSAAEEAIRSYDVKMIYSVSAIGDAHLVGMRLSKKYSIPWVAEFQDPWLDNKTNSEWLKDNALRLYCHLIRTRARSLLKQIIENADLVITESAGHRDALRRRGKKWNVEGEKITFSYLGCDTTILRELGEPRLSKLLRNDGVPMIGFVGKVYYGYEERARNLVKQLKVLEDKGVEFYFISVACRTLPRLVEEVGLRRALSIHPVSYKEAVGFMRLLNWGVVIPSSDININSKLFDYLANGCKVIVWGGWTGEMADLVRERQCGVCIDDKDVVEAAKMLKECLEGSQQNFPGTLTQNGWFTRRAFFQGVMEKMSEIISSAG